MGDNELSLAEQEAQLDAEIESLAAEVGPPPEAAVPNPGRDIALGAVRDFQSKLPQEIPDSVFSAGETPNSPLDAISRLTANNAFQYADHETQENYLKTRGFETKVSADGTQVLARKAGTQDPFGPIEPGDGADLSAGQYLGEIGMDVLDGFNDVLNMGISSKLSTPGQGASPGRLTQNTLAGAAQGPIDASISWLASRALGLPSHEGEFVSPLMSSSLEGGLGNAAGSVMGSLVGKTPAMKKDQAFRYIKRALAAGDDELGAAVATGVEREIATRANPVAYKNAFNGVMNPVDEVIEAVHEKFNLVRPARTSGTTAKEILENIINKGDEVGKNLESVVESVSKDPASTVRISEFKQMLFGNADEIKEAMKQGVQPPPYNPGMLGKVKQAAGVEAPDGREINAGQGGSIQSKIEGFFNTLKESAKKELSVVEKAKDAEYDALINGGKIGNEVLDPLQKLKDKKLKLEERAAANKTGKLRGKPLQELQDLNNKIAQREQQLATLEPEVLKARADVIDPSVSFVELNNWKKNFNDSVATDLARFRMTPNDPTAIALNSLRGEVSSTMGTIASRTPFGMEFGELSKDYSLLSDASKMFQRAAGAEEKLLDASRPYFVGRKATEIKESLPLIPQRLGGKVGMSIEPTPEDAKNLFMRAGYTLPPSAAEERGAGVLRSFAGKLSAARQNGAKVLYGNAGPLTQVILGRSVSSLVKDTIMNPGSASAAELDSLEQGVFMNTLEEAGMITEEQKRNGLDVNMLPPDKLQQATGIAAQVVKPLRDAILFGGEDEVGSAYSQITKLYPDLFPPPKTGIKGEVEVDGKIKLYDPMDRAQYYTLVDRDDSLGWDDKAEIISNLNERFEARPLKRGKK